MLTKEQRDLIESRLPFIAHLTKIYELNEEHYSLLSLRLCELVLKDVINWKVSLYRYAKQLQDEVVPVTEYSLDLSKVCYNPDFKSVCIQADLDKMLSKDDELLLNLLLSGYNRDDIAKQLNVSKSTCCQRVHRLSRKFIGYCDYSFVHRTHFS